MVASAARAQSAPAAAPPTFDQVAQQYVAPLGVIPYDGGQNAPTFLQLTPDGYLDTLTINATLSGQYGTAGPTGADAFAALAGPVARIEIANTQNRGIYNLSGEFAAIVTWLSRYYNAGGLRYADFVAGFNAAPGVAAFADAFQFDLPIGVKIGEFQAPVGLYPVGFLGPAPRVNIYWRPTNSAVGAVNPGSGVYIPAGTSTGPNPVGAADISQIGFANITINSAMPPANYIHSFREGALAINGNQTYTIELTQGAFIGRIGFVVIANGALAPNTAISNLEYDFGFGMRRYQYNNAQLQIAMTRVFGANLPNWLTLLDYYTRTHNRRDWLNTVAVTRPRVLLTLQGLSYGGSQNQIRYFVEEFYPTAAAIAQSVR